MMKNAVLTTLCVLGLLLGTSPVFALKCWTTEDGTTACGDAVPPEYAQKGYEEKNERGMTVSRKGAARSLEDVEAERQAKIEAAKAAEIARRQAKLDQNLLDTFSSEEDMLFARDGQIDHLESQIKLTENRNDKLQKNLDELIKQAATHERGGSEPPEALLRDIGVLEQQIDDNDRFIDTKRAEQKKIREKFDIDIERFRKLSEN